MKAENSVIWESHYLTTTKECHMTLLPEVKNKKIWELELLHFLSR